MELIDIVADEDYLIIEPTAYHIFTFFNLGKVFGEG